MEPVGAEAAIFDLVGISSVLPSLADPFEADPDPSPILQKTNPQKKPESYFDLTKSKSQFFITLVDKY